MARDVDNKKNGLIYSHAQHKVAESRLSIRKTGKSEEAPPTCTGN